MNERFTVMQSSMKIRHIFPIMCSKFQCSSRSTNYWKNIHKFFVFYVAHARKGTILSIVREITLMKMYEDI